MTENRMPDQNTCEPLSIIRFYAIQIDKICSMALNEQDGEASKGYLKTAIGIIDNINSKILNVQDYKSDKIVVERETLEKMKKKTKTLDNRDKKQHNVSWNTCIDTIIARHAKVENNGQ